MDDDAKTTVPVEDVEEEETEIMDEEMDDALEDDEPMEDEDSEEDTDSNEHSSNQAGYQASPDVDSTEELEESTAIGD